MRDGHQRPRQRHRRLTAVIALATLVLGACTSDPPTPAEQRRQRVDDRLSETFSPPQVDCILGDLDTATIQALAAAADLPAESKAMDDYSAAVAACVADVTTTTAPKTTTTKAPATTTTGG